MNFRMGFPIFVKKPLRFLIEMALILWIASDRSDILITSSLSALERGGEGGAPIHPCLPSSTAASQFPSYRSLTSLVNSSVFYFSMVVRMELVFVISFRDRSSFVYGTDFCVSSLYPVTLPNSFISANGIFRVWAPSGFLHGRAHHPPTEKIDFFLPS